MKGVLRTQNLYQGSRLCLINVEQENVKTLFNENFVGRFTSITITTNSSVRSRGSRGAVWGNCLPKGCAPS